MSGLFGVMDCCSPPMMKLLILFLPLPSNIVSLHGNPVTGVDHNLRCVSDYLLTINCSLSIAASENPPDTHSYSLTFRGIYDQEKFVCVLMKTSGDYFCSVKKCNLTPDDDKYYAMTFSDIDTFEILLCHDQNNGSKVCELLDEKYMPLTNIKPNAPCCLTVSHNSSQHHFTWKGAEAYGPFFGLTKNMKYQLQYFESGDRHDVIPHEIHTENNHYSVDDEKFAPDREYTVRVQSSPNQAHYKGQWSDWSGEAHWRMESAVKDPPPNLLVSGLEVFITLCVIMPFLFLLCYAPVKKWRQHAFIPTPAPYFDTLYSDCQGNFKSWVFTQDKMGDAPKGEETVQIDTIIRCADDQDESQPQCHHQLTEGATCKNLTDPDSDTTILAIGMMAPQLTPAGSVKSLTLSSQPGSPAEESTGRWLSSHTSQNTGPPSCYNVYCTLSTAD